MDKAIIVDHLVKNFEVKKKTVHALRGVSFTIQSGELIGFVGQNGSGKTTTLKALSGLIYPTSGFVEVLEHDPWERKTEFLKQTSLVMGQKSQLWWDFPAANVFELNKAVYEIPTRDYEEALSELTTLLEINKYVNVPIINLPLNIRVKMEITASLIHKPKVIFFDEPLIGLDPTSKQKIKDFIYEYNKKHQTTIIFATHTLDDMSDLVRRVIVMDEGKIVFDGVLEDLTNKFAKQKIIRATLSSNDNIAEINKIGKIKKLSFPEVVISVPRSTIAVAASELMQNFPVTNLSIEEFPIEEIVRRIIK